MQLNELQDNYIQRRVVLYSLLLYLRQARQNSEQEIYAYELAFVGRCSWPDWLFSNQQVDLFRVNLIMAMHENLSFNKEEFSNQHSR